MSALIERMHIQVLRAGSLPAGTTQLYDVRVDSDAAFVLRMIDGSTYVDSVPESPGNSLQIRYSDASGRFRQSSPISAPYVLGTGNAQYRPVWPQIVYPAGSTIQVELTNAGAAPITDIRLYLAGVKAFPQGAVWAPQYPECFSTRPFELVNTLVVSTGQTRRGVPMTNTSDLDFVFRGGMIVADDSVTTDPIGGWNDLEIILRDPMGKAYSSDWVAIEQFFRLGSPERPALIFPEIYIPARQMLQMDIRLVDADAAGQLSANMLMSGVKVLKGVRA